MCVCDLVKWFHLLVIGSPISSAFPCLFLDFSESDPFKYKNINLSVLKRISERVPVIRTNPLIIITTVNSKRLGSIRI